MDPNKRFAKLMQEDSRHFEKLLLFVEAVYVATLLVSSNLEIDDVGAARPNLTTLRLLRIFRVPIFLCLVSVCIRVWRLFVTRRCCITSGSWRCRTLHHALALSSFASGAGFSQAFGEAMWSSMYIFMLTISCLTVLDHKQTMIAVLSSFSCYATSIFFYLYISEERNVLSCIVDEVAFVPALVVLCWARKTLLKVRRQDFQHAETLCRATIQEKVKRCHAEFEAELVKSSEGERRWLETATDSAYMEGPFHLSKYHAQSIMSAPPTLGRLEATAARSGCADRHGNDCLPIASQVYVEGSLKAKRSDELQGGDRLLCYDHLLGSLKYVELQDVELISGPVEWTRVVLADGTVMTVTSDHPMRILNSDSAETGSFGLGGGVVRSAKELQPGQDMLNILKLGATPVKEISSWQDEQPRARVNVQHSWRYSIFSQAEETQFNGFGAVAVESSDALLGRTDCKCASDLLVARTFIHFPTDDMAGELRQKPASAPPACFKGACLEAQPEATNTMGEVRSCAELEVHIEAQHVAQEADDWSQIPYLADVGTSSAPAATTDESVWSREVDMATRHALGCCDPCPFEHRHHVKPGEYPCCSKANCRDKLCHEVHSEDYMKLAKRRRNNFQRMLRQQRSSQLWTGSLGY
eukprot:TRINITY_DN16971_c0_g1_i1.p1 TRINITY_DN16971_c0_g1~~TRINITY_DN16971_c0_g1_i1.p1  ORF type:complete len:648 (-),score=111.68 TRINITY_DN16971_c0_g1_i1:63-1982(-)